MSKYEYWSKENWFKRDLISKFAHNKNIVLLGNAKCHLNTIRDIDVYDVVCRCNYSFPNIHACLNNKKAFFDKWRKYLGTRTDILFTSGDSPQEWVVTDLIKPKFIVKTRGDNNNSCETVINTCYPFVEEQWSCFADTENFSPTTGILALYYIIGTIQFNKLDIIGFDFWETSDFDDFSLGKNHDAVREKDWVNRMINIHGNITLLKD
jgi:hypothetical protein